MLSNPKKIEDILRLFGAKANVMAQPYYIWLLLEVLLFVLPAFAAIPLRFRRQRLLAGKWQIHR